MTRCGATIASSLVYFLVTFPLAIVWHLVVCLIFQFGVYGAVLGYLQARADGARG